MAGPYYVYHGATTTDGLSWGGAYTSIKALDTAVTLAAGETVYVASDHVDPETYSGNFTIVGPTSGLPTAFISANRGTTLYEASSTNQINTTGGAYQILWDGSFALYGLCMAAGARSQLVQNDSNEFGHIEGCTFKLASNSDIYLGGTSCRVVFRNCVIDLSADGAGSTAVVILTSNGWFEIQNLTFVSPGNRTSNIINASSGSVFRVSGTDFSEFPSGTEIVSGSGSLELAHCKFTSGAVLSNNSGSATSGYVTAVNCGSSDAPESLKVSYYGSLLESDTTVTRTGGASVEGIAHSWKLVTGATCSEHAPFYTPWRYKTTTNGTKTFTLYIANNTADLTDAECWLEVEAMATADSPLYTLTTDRRVTVTTTPVAQTVDLAGLWSGATLTYQQILSCANVTVGETGLYRVRVAVGKASTTLYIDPEVTVS